MPPIPWLRSCPCACAAPQGARIVETGVLQGSWRPSGPHEGVQLALFFTSKPHATGSQSTWAAIVAAIPVVSNRSIVETRVLTREHPRVRGGDVESARDGAQVGDHHAAHGVVGFGKRRVRTLGMWRPPTGGTGEFGARDTGTATTEPAAGGEPLPAPATAHGAGLRELLPSLPPMYSTAFPTVWPFSSSSGMLIPRRPRTEDELDGVERVREVVDEGCLGEILPSVVPI